MSTPIETNTEGLREILDEVYNLPNRSTGGTHDLTIRIDHIDRDAAHSLTTLAADGISVDAAEVLATADKIVNKQPVKVIMVGEYNYWSGDALGAFFPASVNGYYGCVICEFIYRASDELWVTTIEIRVNQDDNEVSNVFVNHYCVANFST